MNPGNRAGHITGCDIVSGFNRPCRSGMSFRQATAPEFLMRPTSLIAAMLTVATLALPSVADMTTLDDLKIGTPMLRAMLLTPPVGGTVGHMQLHKTSVTWPPDPEPRPSPAD